MGSQLGLHHQPVCLGGGRIYPTLPAGQQVCIRSFLHNCRRQVTTDSNLCEIVQRIDGLEFRSACILAFHRQMQVGTRTVARIPRHAKFLPGIHHIALTDGHTVQVTVGHPPLGSVGTVILDDGEVAASLVTTHLDYAPLVLRGHHILIPRLQVNTVMGMVPVAGGRQSVAVSHHKTVTCDWEGIGLTGSRHRHCLLVCHLGHGHGLLVIFIQPVCLDIRYQRIGIVTVGGIARCLQPVCPTAIVIGGTPATSRIATAHQELRMMLDALLDTGIVTELLIRLVIMMQTVGFALGEPLAAALDAEVVVAGHGQIRRAASRLQIHLGQRHGGRNAIFLLLLHRQGRILLKECCFL